ncbi:GIY-YIG nuclease family protein [Vibrio sp. 404]|uniref:GIY-YIG nuclease family protein n=1 Tax=Vibrio marinisediminis TaxID=2758441 RepID=A0A7W2FTG5_9VIBR|nr:GIY-YIG nuclease family protein [Vibrio marinisediminis]MBA5763964.1 GIY-YIG nuclease family protein [Vibrio marinisediminis]
MSESNTTNWSVYLVRMRSNALYCGITTDVARRFDQHVSGNGAKALKGKGPLVLEWHQILNDSRSMASKVEIQLKRQNKSVKEALISGEKSLIDVVSEDLYDEIYCLS